MLKLKEFLNRKALLGIKNEDFDLKYATAIQELGNNHIGIAIPYHRLKPIMLHDNEIVEIKLYGEGDFYLIQCRVLGKKKDTVPLYLLSLPDRVERIQQRNFVRIPALINVRFWLQKRENPYDEPEGEPLTGRTLDISGGGMKLVVKSPLKAGQEIFIEFVVPGQNLLIETNARVIRSEFIEVSKGKLNAAGLEFVGLDENLRDRMVAFIFRKMVEQHKMIRD